MPCVVPAADTEELVEYVSAENNGVVSIGAELNTILPVPVTELDNVTPP